MKKILTISTILVLLLMLSVLPVFADAPSFDHTGEHNLNTNGTYVDVADITSADSLHSADARPTVNINVVPGDNKDIVTVSYDSAQLKILADKGSRPEDAAWLGIRLTPKDTKYTHYTFSGSEGVKALGTPQCHNRYIPVTGDILEKAVKDGKVENGQYVIFEGTFTWYTSQEANGEDAPTTELKVVLNAEKTVVYNKEDDEEEWNSTIYEETVEANKKEEPAQKPAESQKDKTPKTGI